MIYCIIYVDRKQYLTYRNSTTIRRCKARVAVKVTVYLRLSSFCGNQNLPKFQ